MILWVLSDSVWAQEAEMKELPISTNSSAENQQSFHVRFTHPPKNTPILEVQNADAKKEKQSSGMGYFKVPGSDEVQTFAIIDLTVLGLHSEKKSSEIVFASDD